MYQSQLWWLWYKKTKPQLRVRNEGVSKVVAESNGGDTEEQSTEPYTAEVTANRSLVRLNNMDVFFWNLWSRFYPGKESSSLGILLKFSKKV